jgi:hypothetical protein
MDTTSIQSDRTPVSPLLSTLFLMLLVITTNADSTLLHEHICYQTVFQNEIMFTTAASCTFEFVARLTQSRDSASSTQ